jgi:hypothetical protein
MKKAESAEMKERREWGIGKIWFDRQCKSAITNCDRLPDDCVHAGS